jgi:muramoyltetrapeptide carboxypeptidase
MKHKYQPLKKGDIVDIIAPAYGIKEQEIKKIDAYIRSLGLIPRIPSDILAGDIICSAPKEVRFKHLKDALYAKDSKAVWCIKGGSGSPQLITELAKLKKPKQQKLFIGFSDITSIHFFLTQSWGWETLHAPILWQIVRERIDDVSIKQVENVIFGRDYVREFPLTHISKKIPAKEITCSSILGGNLKLVQCSIGTVWQIKAKNKILLFEDINEKPYQVDRILTHISQSNLMKGAKAIVFGDFEGGDEEMDGPLIDKVLERFAADTDIPVFRTTGIGHTMRNYAVHFGRKGKIEVGKTSSKLFL